MSSSTLIFVIGFAALLSYGIAIRRAISVSGGRGHIKNLESLPRQFGLLIALACGLPSLLILLLWSVFEPMVVTSLLASHLPPEIQSLSSADISLYLNNVHIIADRLKENSLVDGSAELIRNASTLLELQNKATWFKTIFILLVTLSVAIYFISRISIKYKARHKIDKIVTFILLMCSGVALLTTFGIIISVLFESIQFFKSVEVYDFLFGTQWSPQVAMRVDQVAGSGAFGAVPLFVGTMLISAIAMTLAVPVGLMIAIYLSQYATRRFKSFAKPMLEILAGVPTVVYGFFAALTVAPLLRDFGTQIGLSIVSESALAAGLVMGIMIIPFVSSLSEDAISAVPESLTEGSLGMGATRSETIKNVLLPAALPGIVGALLLAVSRAIGETMIVVMAAGLAANLTINPLESVTTVTVQIVTLLTGDQEFDSPKTLAAFALGLMLFITTLILNIIALKVVRKYREQYE